MPQRKCFGTSETPGCGAVYPLVTGVCTHHPEPMPVGLETGTIVSGLGNTYSVEYLGAGAMGVAYKATDRSTGNTVVLKELLPVNDPTDMADRLRRFIREAEIQKRLSDAHPNVDLPFPRGFGSFTDSTIGREFMAMEFIPGQDLIKMLKASGPLSRLLVLQVGIEVCDALAYLHNFADPATGNKDPVVHRDLKPNNMMACPLTSGDVTILILDFGIARRAIKSAGTAALGAKGTIAGTSEYWAPEQIGAFGGNIDGRTDIYALGCTMYKLFTAQIIPPQPALRPREIATNVTDQVMKPVITRAMQNQPAARFQTVEDMRAELVRLYEAEQPLPAHLRPAVVTPPVTPPIPTPSPAPLKPDRIKWVGSKTHLHTPTYHQDLAGWIKAGRKLPVAGVNVVLDQIRDSDGTTPAAISGAVLTDATGWFELDLQDTTVPDKVASRLLYIRVEDTAGQLLFRDRYTIERPRDWAGFGAKVKGGAKSTVKWLTVPVWGPFYVLWLLLAGLGRLISSADAPTVARRLGWFLLAVSCVVAQLAMRWNWLQVIWPHLGVAGLCCWYLSWLLRRAQNKKPPRPPSWAWRRAIINPLTIFWTVAWTGYFLSRLLGGGI